MSSLVILSCIVTKKNSIHDKKITNGDFFSSVGMARYIKSFPVLLHDVMMGE